MRRREFLITSSTSAVVFSLASRAGAASSTAVGAVIYEPRYSAACEFAQRQVERGARAFGTNECMVRLWRGPLAQALNRGETGVAGVTLYSDFDIARSCARERGLKVLHETRWRCGSVTLVSWLIGS